VVKWINLAQKDEWDFVNSVMNRLRWLIGLI